MWFNRWIGRLFLAALVIGLALPILSGYVPGAQAQTPIPNYSGQITAEQLSAHVRALAVDIGTRPAGSQAEAQAAAYIAGQLGSWGYDVQEQPFEQTPANGAPFTSRNIIATRPGSGGVEPFLAPTIVVGAHMDSVETTPGAGDNASGVAAMLAVAQTVASLDNAYPLAFVAFGAEEAGLRGSRYFVDALPDSSIANILVMVNLDSVAMGDYFYAYAGAITDSYSYREGFIPGPTWARDLMLTVGESLGHLVRTSPQEGWNGFVGPWSDHYPFAQQGVPVVYLERWNWDAGPDPAWGQETSQGDYMHTARDIFGNVDATRIEPVAETAASFVALLITGPYTPPQ